WLPIFPINLEAIFKTRDTTFLERWSHIKEALDDAQTILRIPAHYRMIIPELITLHKKIGEPMPTSNTELKSAVEAITALTRNVEKAAEIFENVLSDFTNLAERSASLFRTADYRTLFDLEYHTEVEALRTYESYLPHRI
ncbi:MAG: hypothetical protein ACREBC_14845, partial [Pyrinomonadaceae bacterium]